MSLTNISTSDPAFVHAVQQVLEVLGTLAFAVSGIRHAAAKHLDWFGGYVCGFAVAVGGGTLRDVMLGTTPFWMTSPIYVICTFAALGFVVCFGRHIRWIDNAWFVFDTLGLALFVIAGIQKTVAFEHPYWVAIIMGSMTGAAGGVIRDVLLNNVPVIFHKEIYAQHVWQADFYTGCSSDWMQAFPSRRQPPFSLYAPYACWQYAIILACHR